MFRRKNVIKRSEEGQANDSGERGHTKRLNTKLASAAGCLLLWWDVGGARSAGGWQRASAVDNTGGRVLGVRYGTRAEGSHHRDGSCLGRRAGGGERRGRAIARGSQRLDDAKNGTGSRVGGRCGRQAVVVAWRCWCGGLAVAVGSDSAGALEDGSRGDKRRGGIVEEAHSECGETCRLGSPMGSQVGCAMTEWWNAEATRLVC